MDRLRKAIFIALVAAEILVQYVDVPAIRVSLGPIALLCWAFAFGQADRMSKRISLVLVSIGALLYLRNRVPISDIAGSFAQNTSVLMIMTLIPLVGVAVDLGGYADALSLASRSVRNPRSLYMLALLLSFTIGSVLLNAAIALLWVVLFPVVERLVKEPRWFLVKALPRGYDASLLWTPASPSTAVALTVSGATWTAIAAPGFAISLVMLAIAIAFEWRALRPAPVADETVTPAPATTAATAGAAATATAAASGEDRTADTWGSVDRETKRKLAGLAIGLFSFIASIVVMEALGVTIYQAILPCVLGTLFVWTALLGKLPEAAKGLVKRLDDSMSRMSTQFLLMTTAGFIGTAVKFATAGGLPGYLSALGENRLAFTAVVSCSVTLLSAACIHPQIGMVIGYSLVASVAPSYSPAHICLALLLGASLGFNLSPVSATMLVTSACAQTNSIEVGLKSHWRYALVVLPVVILILSYLILI
jgi:DcuC family C4-dicarboxylate transporter